MIGSGSPQMLLVEDGSRPHAYGPALEHAVNVDSAATILFDPKKSKGGLKVHIRSKLMMLKESKVSFMLRS